MDVGIKLVKLLMIIFNFIFFAVGLLLIVCGALVMTKFRDYVAVLGNSFNAAPMVIIFVGVVIFLVAFFGCCGAWKESYCMMMTFTGLMVALLVLQLVTFIAALVMKSKVRAVVTEPLKTALDSYHVKDQYKRVLDKIQSGFECCGVEGPADWNKNATAETAVPPSCCTNPRDCTQATAFQKGCLDKLDYWVEANIVLVAAVAVAVCFLQLIGIMCACCLGRSIRDEYQVMK